MRIDTHQHFWIYNSRQYAWMGPNMEKLRRDYLPDELLPLLNASNIDETVAVQARQCLEESYWLLELAGKYPFIKGVVGWVDLCSPKVEEQLEKLAQHRRLCGIRHVVHDEPDDQFMMREDFQRGIKLLANYKLTYDLLLFPRHLPVAYELVKLFPQQAFVIDHIAKPLIREHRLEPWRTDIRKIAQFENVFCKISGLVTEANWEKWKPSDFEPFLDTVLESFGPQRLMIGSDWPVCTLAGTYSDVMQVAATYIEKLSATQQSDIWRNNAKRFYRILG